MKLDYKIGKFVDVKQDVSKFINYLKDIPEGKELTPKEV